MRALQPDFEAFLRATTSVASPSLCPEIALHLAADLDALWAEQERIVGRPGLAAPFWGVAWPGGQALARFVLDHPDAVAGRSVLDLGSGCGLVAIAAARAGARRVQAADIDAFARDAIAANASLNHVELEILGEDLIGAPSRWEVVLAADLWYERFLAVRLAGWLRELAAGGTRVLLGDRGRAYFPRAGLAELQRYPVPSQSFERDAYTDTAVWEVAAGRVPGPA